MKPDVKKLRGLCEKATPGPWEWIGLIPSGFPFTAPTKSKGDLIEAADMEFIAEARNQIPALLDYIEKLERVGTIARWVVTEPERTGWINSLKKVLAALEGEK